jgi:hypothetical protein
MAARMDETRLANLGHQERCSRGDRSLRFRGHRPFGAQGKQECLCYERRLADLVRDGIGYGLGVRSHLGLQTVGLNAGTQCRDSMQGFRAGIQGRLAGALLQRSLEV